MRGGDKLRISSLIRTAEMAQDSLSVGVFVGNSAHFLFSFPFSDSFLCMQAIVGEQKSAVTKLRAVSGTTCFLDCLLTDVHGGRATIFLGFT